ncbi:MAG: hypothetical protein ACOYJ6_15860, partial [Caulobacterales bacterium]
AQQIGKGPWLGQRNHIILRHGVSSFDGKWRLDTTTIRRFTLSCRHQLLGISRLIASERLVG